MRRNYLSHPAFCNEDNYLSILGLNLNYVSKSSNLSNRIYRNWLAFTPHWQSQYWIDSFILYLINASIPRLPRHQNNMMKKKLWLNSWFLNTVKYRRTFRIEVRFWVSLSNIWWPNIYICMYMRHLRRTSFDLYPLICFNPLNTFLPSSTYRCILKHVYICIYIMHHLFHTKTSCYWIWLFIHRKWWLIQL